MNFEFDDSQKLLRESIARFVEREYDPETRREKINAGLANSPEVWKTFAEQGWLIATLDEDLGGLGDDPINILAVAEEFGKGLITEAYCETVILGLGALQRSNLSDKDKLIEEVITGELHLTVAFQEGQFANGSFGERTAATRSGDGYTLNGFKGVVTNAPDAGKVLVVADFEGDRSLFLVDIDASGVDVVEYPTIDGRKAADITFSNTPVLARVDEGNPDLLEHVELDYLLWLGSEQVGAMQRAHELTLQYARERKQFGVAIGSFQVIQHYLVDMLTKVEQSRSMMYMAGMKRSASLEEARKAVYALKAYVSQAAQMVCEQAVQIHGGMGVTDEMPISHYMKRITAVNAVAGDSSFYRRQFARLSQKATS